MKYSRGLPPLPPLRITIPVVLLLFAITVGLQDLQQNTRIACRRVEEYTRQELTQHMAEQQDHLELLLRLREPERVREEIASLGTDPHVKTALLLDETGRVAASTRRVEIGQPGQALQPELFTPEALSASPRATGKHAADSPGAFDEMAEHLRTTQSQLEERESHIRLLLDSAAEGIFGLDLEGCCTFVNRSAMRMLGYTDLGELLGQDAHSLWHHSRADGSPYPRSECPIFRAMETGTENHVEGDVLWRKDGTSLPVERWSYPIRQGGRRVGGVACRGDPALPHRGQHATGGAARTPPSRPCACTCRHSSARWSQVATGLAASCPRWTRRSAR